MLSFGDEQKDRFSLTFRVLISFPLDQFKPFAIRAYVQFAKWAQLP